MRGLSLENVALGLQLLLLRALSLQKEFRVRSPLFWLLLRLDEPVYLVVEGLQP